MSYLFDEFSDEFLEEEFPNFKLWADEEGISLRKFLEHVIPRDPIELTDEEQRCGMILAAKLGLVEGAQNG